MPTRLRDLRSSELPRAGGKAANCARLLQAGFPVPDGLVVFADATDAEVRELPSDPWFEQVPAATRFAVRSSGIGEDSAGHSFAGIHQTRLDVGRDQIVEAALACRASAVSAEARAYRESRGISEDAARIAVLIQVMVPAATSGVAFTINPITGADEIVINAARGLGEALVSGQIDPDEYRVGPRDGALLASRAAAPDSIAVLTPPQIAELAGLLTRIARHYDAPQDVEWCHDGRQFWIVQSRPITTNPAPRTSHLSDVEWTRANLAEVLPDQVSPQAAAVFIDLLNRGERMFFGRLMAPESELGPIVKMFHGRMYFNLSQLRRVTDTVGAAPADTLRSFGHSEQIRPEDEIAKRPRFGRLLRALPDLARLAIRSLSAGRIYRRHQANITRLMARLSVDPNTQSDQAIAATIDWWTGEGPSTMTAVFVMGSVQMFEDVLRKACKTAGFPYDRLVYPQLASGECSVSTQQAVDLVALAEIAREHGLDGTAFLDAFDRFIERYGHRGHYETDWALPRLRENPAPVLFAIRTLLESPPQDLAAAATQRQAEAATAWREFEARLTPVQRLTLLPRVRATMRMVKQRYLWREAVRSDLTRVVSRVRDWHLVLAGRFVSRGWIDRRDDYFLLELDEVTRAARDPSRGPELRAIAARRAAQREAERDLRLPLLMRESELPSLLRAGRANTVPAAGVSTLTGLCVSPGFVEAEVVVMRDPGEFAAMKRGAILVTTATDPSWTPLFTLASGVIVEVGGMLSHASTIAREYGLPALANVKGATRVLKTGDRVTLDATGGRVLR